MAAEHYRGYKDDDLARELMKRFVQAVGRAFYDDSNVAVLDVLCEDPYCLIDARTMDPIENPDAEKRAEDDEDSDKEDEDDVRKKSMDKRMNLSLKEVRTILNGLVKENLVKTMENDKKHTYFYIDYEWFFKIVSYRLTKMTEDLTTKETSLRKDVTYFCPLCAAEITQAQFRVPYCQLCVNSGENKPEECHLKERNNTLLLEKISSMRKKMESQLFMKYSPPNADRSTLAKLLLGHIKDCETQKKPIYPIPIYDIKKLLDQFESVGIPRGGYGQNIEVVQKLIESSRKKTKGEDKGIFTAQHFINNSQSSQQIGQGGGDYGAAGLQGGKEQEEEEEEEEEIDTAQIAKRAKLELAARESQMMGSHSAFEEEDEDEFEDG